MERPRGARETHLILTMGENKTIKIEREKKETKNERKQLPIKP